MTAEVCPNIYAVSRVFVSESEILQSEL